MINYMCPVRTIECGHNPLSWCHYRPKKQGFDIATKCNGELRGRITELEQQLFRAMNVVTASVQFSNAYNDGTWSDEELAVKSLEQSLIDNGFKTDMESERK